MRPDEGREAEKAIKLAPFLESLTSRDNLPTVFLYARYSCQSPITEVGELKKVLNETKD
jgi:hypothetical protein